LRPSVFGWLLAVEVVCLTGATVSLLAGKVGLGLVLLVAPINVMVWIALAGDSHRFLVFLAALIPLASLELLPRAYAQLVLYPGIVLSLSFLRLAGSMSEGTRPSRLLRSERIPLLGLSLSVVVAALSAVAHGWADKHLLQYTVLSLEVLVIAYFFAVVPQTFLQVYQCICFAAAGLLLTLVSMFFLPPVVGEGGALGGKTILTPFGVANLNAFATVVASVAAMVLGLLVGSQRLRVRAALAVTFVLLIVALLLTKSRGAWLGLGLAFLYVVVSYRSLRLTLVAAAVALLLLSVESLRHVLLARVGQTTTADPSLLGRYVLWFYALKVAKANWLLGVGMENFRVVKHLYGYPAPLALARQYNAHNIYLEYAADLGIFGLGFLLWLLGGTVKRLHRWAQVSVPESRGVAVGLGAGIIAYATHGLLDAVVWQHGAYMLLGMMLGLAMCVRRLCSSGSGGACPGISPTI
jgi:O-antigen ligase